MARRKTARAAQPKVAVGDFVLCGGSAASTPSGWYLGEVLWAGEGDALIQRSTLNGRTWREVAPVSHIRAVGTIAKLVDIQRRAAEEVRDLNRAIDEAAQKLGAARDALWRRVAEMAEGGLKVYPPDFSKIESERAAHVPTADADDEERAPLRALEGVW